MYPAERSRRTTRRESSSLWFALAIIHLGDDRVQMFDTLKCKIENLLDLISPLDTQILITIINATEKRTAICRQFLMFYPLDDRNAIVILPPDSIKSKIGS